MRFSKLLISLALVLSISSVAAQTIMSGTWSSPYTTTNTNSYCCVPTSIYISCSSSSSSSCTATYNYPNNINSKCWSLFMSSTSGKMSIYQSSSTYYTESFYSETTFFGKMSFNYLASNTTGTPTLRISGTSSYSSGSCDFTMTSRVAPASGGAGGLFIILVIVFLCCGAGGAKQYQKRQATVIVAQNLAQPVITVQQPAPIVQVHQQTFVQPQPTYIAPNQFPNTQVNMNYGVPQQQFPNTQVNMGFGGNNAGFQAQARF